MGSNNLPVLASWVAEPEEGLCGLGWILGCQSEKQLSHMGARNWMKVLSHLSSPLCISYKKFQVELLFSCIFRSLIIVLIPYHRSLSLSRPQQVRWLTFYDRVYSKIPMEYPTNQRNATFCFGLVLIFLPASFPPFLPSSLFSSLFLFAPWDEHLFGSLVWPWTQNSPLSLAYWVLELHG